MRNRYKLIAEDVEVDRGDTPPGLVHVRHIVKVVDTKTGQEIRGIRSAVARFELDEPNKLEIELIDTAAEVAVDELALFGTHPITGKTMQIREIVYEDGSSILVSQGHIIESDRGD